ILKHPYSEPIATGPSKVALISRSTQKSHYLVRSSAPGNSKVVLPLSDATCLYSGLREERALVRRFSCVFVSGNLSYLLVLRSSKISCLCAILDWPPWHTS